MTSTGGASVISRPSLCPAFRAAASSIHSDITRGRAVNLVPWETSLTDYLLLTLATQHPREILTHRFGADGEAHTGADWEWWFRDHDDYVGVRIQAKHRYPRRGYRLKQRAPGGILQAERLRDRASARGLSALYCLYGDQQPTPSPASAIAGPCPHGPLDPTQWGCSLLLVDTAIRHARSKRVSTEQVLRDSWPLFHLVCGVGSRSGVTGNARFLVWRLLEA